jgi:hypothetical protein
VGIENRHKVHLRKNFAESLKKTKSLRISMKLCQVGIEQVQGVRKRRTRL